MVSGPMKTDDLIEALAGRLEPASPRAPLAWLALWVAAGVAVSFLVMVLWRGLRPDLHVAMTTPMFWSKFFYTLMLGAAALWLAERMGRPGAKVSRPARALQAVVLGFIALAVGRYMAADEPARHSLLMGHSAMLCPWCILVLSLPILAGALYGLRRFAPTRPTLAGFAAGLAAGGAGAFVYAFSCNESGMPFVAVWYTLPVLLAGLIGAVAGRFTLRW